MGYLYAKGHFLFFSSLSLTLCPVFLFAKSDNPQNKKWQPILQYSCLENPMDRGVWQTTVHGVAKESDMTE